MKTLKLIDELAGNFFITGLRACGKLDGAYQVMIAVPSGKIFLHSKRFEHYRVLVDGNGQTLPLEATDYSEAQAVRLAKKICKHIASGGKLDSAHWSEVPLSILYSVGCGSDNPISIQFDGE